MFFLQQNVHKKKINTLLSQRIYTDLRCQIGLKTVGKPQRILIFEDRRQLKVDQSSPRTAPKGMDKPRSALAVGNLAVFCSIQCQGM